MPNYCVVNGCENFSLSVNKTYSFHRFPNCSLNNNKKYECSLLCRRRDAWLNAVNLNSMKISSTSYVCSLHFVHGKPAHYLDEENVDWVPTLFMGNLHTANSEGNNISDEKVEGGHEDDLNNRIPVSLTSATDYSVVLFSKETENSCPRTYVNEGTDSFFRIHTLSESYAASHMIHEALPSSSKDTSNTEDTPSLQSTTWAPQNLAPALEPRVTIDDQSDIPLTHEKISSVTDQDSCQQVTEIVTDSSNCKKKLKMEIEELKRELTRKEKQLLEKDRQIAVLRTSQKEVLESRKIINIIRENDARTRFYTGLSSWNRFMSVFRLCEPAVVEISKRATNLCKLSLVEQLLLTLMRLRLYLKVEDLATRFEISQSTATRYISKWIDVMYVRLATNLMVWPNRDELLLTMPMIFRQHFRRCVVIIDCFEVGCQRFTDLLDRCSTYSNYKSRATVKFLIGITPQGTISYISQGYGGRSSDVYITEDSKHIAVVASDENLIKNLLPGDVVLADRGFLISEPVALMMAELVTPAFKGSRSQLSQIEIEKSRRVSNVRIHVERVIGQLRRTFTILEGTLSINELRSDEDGLAFIDKIAFVCCCLLNANEGVVPSA